MMVIRPANHIDIMRLFELADEMHARSVYATRCTMDREIFRRLCCQAISNHGKDKCLFVADHDGVVGGFIMGIKDRVYGIGKELYATDLFFYVSEDAHPRSASKLLDAFIEWGEAQKDVVELFMGVSGAIGDFERIQKIYERKGFQADGVMLSKAVNHE
jgi:GNAT superfamily N-acetyltransferase